MCYTGKKTLFRYQDCLNKFSIFWGPETKIGIDFAQLALDLGMQLDLLILSASSWSSSLNNEGRN